MPTFSLKNKHVKKLVTWHQYSLVHAGYTPGCIILKNGQDGIIDYIINMICVAHVI